MTPAGGRTTRSSAATLLGRGGAGFPAGVKWGSDPAGRVAALPRRQRRRERAGHVQGPPADRARPPPAHRGLPDRALRRRRCRRCFLYVRGEIALAQERVATALNEAYAAGSVGTNIFGSDFSVDIVMHWGAGAYIVGEETALHREPRGQAGHAPPQAAVLPGRHRPLRPADHRQQRRDAVQPAVDRAPTAAPPSPALGTETSPGTRMFAVSGHVKRPGVLRGRQRHDDVPRPDLRRRVLAAASATATSSRRSSRRRLGALVRARAARPAARRATLVGAAGSMLGSGAIVVMDETTDMVRAALALAALLRPRVVRQVHAVPRGRHVARADPAAASSTATARPRTSTCCSTSATRSAPAPFPTRQRGLGLDGRAVPVQDDDDLRPRPVGLRRRCTRRSRCSATSSRPTSSPDRIPRPSSRPSPCVAASADDGHPKPASVAPRLPRRPTVPGTRRRRHAAERAEPEPDPNAVPSRSTAGRHGPQGRADHRRRRARRRRTSRASATTPG